MLRTGWRWAVVPALAMGLATGAIAGERQVTLRVPDMTCDMCRGTVERALAPLAGVVAVDVNLETKLVRVYALDAGGADARAMCEALDAHHKPAEVVGVSTTDTLRGVPLTRVSALARGVNLSHWLWLPKKGTGGGAFIDASDMALLRGAGFTHVRLPFEPARVWDASAHALKPQGVGELRDAITLAAGAGLAVVVDAHPNESPWALPDAEGACPELELCWSALAGALKDLDPSRVMFELMNEPHGLEKAKAGAWAAASRSLFMSVRDAAPEHTIIASGDDWSNIQGLTRAAPGVLANVVYTFHFYEPHAFTHQGATWGAPHWKHIAELPYPFEREGVEKAAKATQGDKAAAADIRAYARDAWDGAVVRRRIGEAAAWGRANHVALYCGEFGAYRGHAPDASRQAWLRDVTGALREARIPWAMWDYAGGFSIADGEPGQRTLHAPTREALGTP